MPAPKGNQNALGNKGGAGGPRAPMPSKELLAKEIARLGATDEDLARCFDVTERTITAWKKENIEFASALKEGKSVADELVEASLFHRATGYSHGAVKIFCDPKTGKNSLIEYVEHYPPDTTACIFWLKNRRPDLWKDKHELAVISDPAKSGESALQTWLARAATAQGLTEPLEATPDNLRAAIEAMRPGAQDMPDLLAFLDQKEQSLARGQDSEAVS